MDSNDTTEEVAGQAVDDASSHAQNQEEQDVNVTVVPVSGQESPKESHQANFNKSAKVSNRNDDMERAEGLEDPEDVNTADVETMKDAVFFLHSDIKRRLSQFWMLIILASLIATTGVAGDSAATVIGAMIVAPLMTPILGTMLSIILLDRKNFLFSLLLVISGAGSAILIGYLFGLISDDATIVKENNSQVAARVEPKTPDLIGALATGMVGSIALVRKDIAGTLPGVAIAISLVPPLCVAGLAFSTGDTADASGALLLFFTNFVSILVMGVAVMYFYKIHLLANQNARDYRAAAIVILSILLLLVGTALSMATIRLRKTRDIEKCLTDKADRWASPQGWETSIVIARENGGKYTAEVHISGPPPFPSADDFPTEVDSDTLCDVDELELIFKPENKISFDIV